MQMNVLLTVPTSRAFLGYSPCGLLHIAAYILHYNKDIDVKIIDFGVNDFSEQRYIKELQHFRPDIVGISMGTFHLYGAIQIANITKKIDSNILVVTGGPHATARPSDCLEWCDDNPPRKRINNLDELPFPAYHLVDIKKYEYPMMAMVGSRGCPYNCTYCFSPIMWERKLTMRSPKNIVDEIEFLHDQYGCSGINFRDDTLNIPLKRGIKICDEIIKRELNKDMNFRCQLRMDRQFVSPYLFKKMKEANFKEVMFGVESGSKKVLDLMNKSLSIDEIKKAIKMSKNEGLKTTGFFMVGNYGEGLLDILKTWRLIMEMKLDRPCVGIAIPFPETEFYNILKKEGYIQKELDWSKATTGIPVVRTDKMSKREIYLFYRLISFSSIFASKNRKERIPLLKRMPHRLKEIFRTLRAYEKL
jgi:radical SAM superfamily enzyme YgiQ (UPF0313 family)